MSTRYFREDLQCWVEVEHKSSHGDAYRIGGVPASERVERSLRQAVSVSHAKKAKRFCMDCLASLEGEHGKTVRCKVCAKVRTREQKKKANRRWYLAKRRAMA